MTIDSVKVGMFVQAHAQGSEKPPAELRKGLLAVIIDIMYLFYALQNIDTWREVMESVTRIIRRDTSDLGTFDALVVCGDMIRLSQARTFTGQTRAMKDATPSKITELPKSQIDDLLLSSEDCFPFPGADPDITFLDAYKDRRWRQLWLYPMLVRHLPSFLKVEFGETLPLILSGFTSEFVFVNELPIDRTQALPKPVEGDFQIAVWSLHFLEKTDHQVVTITPDGDLFMTALIRMDVPDFPGRSRWWWFRNTPASPISWNRNRAYFNLAEMHTQLTRGKMSGLVLSMLFMACGTDYVNPKDRPKDEKRLDRLNLDTMYATVASKGRAWSDGLVYENEVEGYNILDVRVDDLAEVLICDRNRIIDADAYALAVRTAAQIVWSINYYKKQPLDNSEPISMTLKVDGSSYFGFAQPMGDTIVQTTDIAPHRLFHRAAKRQKTEHAEDTSIIVLNAFIDEALQTLARVYPKQRRIAIHELRLVL